MRVRLLISAIAVGAALVLTGCATGDQVSPTTAPSSGNSIQDELTQAVKASQDQMQQNGLVETTQAPGGTLISVYRPWKAEPTATAVPTEAPKPVAIGVTYDAAAGQYFPLRARLSALPFTLDFAAQGSAPALSYDSEGRIVASIDGSWSKTITVKEGLITSVTTIADGQSVTVTAAYSLGAKAQEMLGQVAD